MEATHFDGETWNIWNPILFLNTDYGRFSIGAPKFVFNTYTLDNAFNSAGLVSIAEFGKVTASFSRLLALDVDELIPGISYDGQFGQSRIGVSYNNYSEGPADLDMWAVAVRDSFTNIDVFAAYERASENGFSLDHYAVGAQGNYGSLGYGLAYRNGAVFSEDIDSISGYLDYDITEQIAVKGEVVRINTPGDDINIYGLSADYTFWKNAYLGLWYFDFDQGGDPLYSARLGRKLDY